MTIPIYKVQFDDLDPIELPIDIEHLKKGTLVFFDPGSKQSPPILSTQQSQNAIQACVTNIHAKSNELQLRSRLIYRDDLPEVLDKAFEKRIPIQTLNNCLDSMSKCCNVSKLHLDSVWDGHPLQTVYAVSERLDLINRLGRVEVDKELWWHSQPIRIYLALTCFDLIGQPSDWLPFQSWLESKRTKAEVAAVDLSAANGDPPAQCMLLWRSYNQKYGVKNGFYKCINTLLDDRSKNRLLHSIRIETTDMRKTDKKRSFANENEKLKFLFDIRNSFTHKAQFSGGHGESLTFPAPREIKFHAFEKSWNMYNQQLRNRILKTVFVSDWPRIPIETIREALCNYISQWSHEFKIAYEQWRVSLTHNIYSPYHPIADAQADY